MEVGGQDQGQQGEWRHGQKKKEEEEDEEEEGKRKQ